jgi:uncharacterized membrane protein HdeD (DUF308 family)
MFFTQARNRPSGAAQLMSSPTAALNRARPSGLLGVTPAISLLAGLLGIAAAIVTVLWPAITVLVLTVLVATLLIGVGVVEIVLAVRMR